jgi:gliding motility-associated-like protein
LTIYNRWGNEVYHAEGYKNSWRGTFDGKDLPDGTYFYRLEIKNQKPRNGFVEIKR